MSENVMKHHVELYRKVFFALLIFTGLTVSASYFNFDLSDKYIAGAVFIGLLIAAVKGILVALNFMHLNNEKKIIYWVLALTAVFFVVLFSIPILWESNLMGEPFWNEVHSHVEQSGH